MNALHVISSIEQEGCQVEEGNGQLHIKKGERLSPSIVEAAKEHKAEIVRIFQLDRQAKEAGLLIYIPGTLYGLTINKSSGLYVERVNGQFEAWREMHYNGRRIEKIIATGECNQVLKKVESYLNYIKEVDK